jgi:hypothetical protein
VTGDFRVSSDNIGMVMHSSPVEIWESLDCFNKKVEEMTAEENSNCEFSSSSIGLFLTHVQPNPYFFSILPTLMTVCLLGHMINPEYTFSTVPEVLEWAGDRVNFMFCVKESSDIPRAISTLIENRATTRAFLEIGVDDMLNVAETNVAGWEEVYYVIEIYDKDDLER